VGDFMTRQRNFCDGDVQFRLKSILFDPKNEGLPRPTLSEYCNQPTKWPTCLAISVNGDAGVDFRRKAHYGTDLSTDITDLLQEGRNEITIGAIFTPQEMQSRFLFAIEIICVADHNKLIKMPLRIPAAVSLAAITNSLKSTDDDDDLIVSQPVRSIDLADPFTTTMWVTPVRGRNCPHKECFDLEAFLLSRTSRRKENGLNSPEQWKCPICKNDARPPMLVLDEFLLEVRKTLEKNGQLDARAILVKEDGSWEPKLDPISKDGARDTPDSDVPMTGTATDSKDETRPSVAAGATSASATPQGVYIPVIDLSDDDD